MAYRYHIQRPCGSVFPYEAEAYDAHAILGVSTEGKDITWAGTLGVIAKRKHDGLWVTAMIGGGWQNNKGQNNLSRHSAIMTGTGYATAWQAWKHREDKQ